MKLKRRQILIGGMAAGITSTIGTEYLQRKAAYERQKKLEALVEKTPRDTDSLLEATFEADARKINQGKAIQASVKLTPPKIPYNRETSKLLILCSRIATEQYLKGKVDPDYDGSIKSLKNYSSKLDGYTQIASFKGNDVETEENIEVEVPTTAQSNSQDPVERDVNSAQNQVKKTVKEIVKLRQKVSVYIGFVLTSKTNNIIVFRGSQTRVEWINNLTAFQKDYTDPISGQHCGKIHLGFLDNYHEIIEPIPREIAKKLNPSVPCYISGHSLGAALATLAALDIALNVPQLRKQLQLYVYASPRVGDATFAKLHNKMIPNSYRVVNNADAFNLVPPTNTLGIYIHIGQEWSFLSQNGDLLPNHVVDTYRAAINRGIETKQ
ncbi:lipase family protein [Iningainema tapete]|uniref:DUF2974 domain-containing protein n=1 Tax=Iningainema tapete BLCC-T55 TaxID=2748662 RepID=A0A8J6XG96_9CYAN|nr:DUF2974 domain-containing protein [Iningainema tapete]MBD2775299.1 DUF2974 domain-containing protein [Iningainema tapete BLCC-T55]